VSGTSSARTIRVLPTASGALLCSLAQRWPAKDPGDVLDYSVDLSAWLADAAGDSFATITVTPEATTPGDLAILMLSANNNSGLITCWLGYGIEYDDYTMDITVLTVGGRTLDFSISLFIQSGPEIPLPANPPVPMSWSSGAVVVGPTLTEVVDNIQAAGNSQSTATVLTGVTNIITGGSSGGGVDLPAIITGTIRVLNRWPGNALLVYPPPGAQVIETLAPAAPMAIAANSGADFSLAMGSTTWRVS